MKSYVPVTFAFLGIAFFQLSDGSDYAPRVGSLQAVAAERAAATPVVASAQVPAQLSAQKPAKADVPSTRSAPLAGYQGDVPAVVTRATLNLDAIGDLAASTSTEDSTAARLESYSLARLAPAPLAPGLATGDQSGAQTAAPEKDMRNVLKSRVNLRMGPGTKYNAIAKLDLGAKVELLQNPGNGWVKLRVVDTGRVGWMADTLISAAN